MLLIGLTGGIASGKTVVSDTFAELGAPIVDADLLAREVVAKDSVGLQSLQKQFGDSVITASGELDRGALRDIIFQDETARAQVDALLHPLIRSLSEERIQAVADSDADYVIHAIPLLVETGQVDRHDRILVVDVPTRVQIERLMKRDDCNLEKAEAILAAQATREQRLAVATDVIDNTKSIEQTQQQVKALHELYTQLNRESKR